MSFLSRHRTICAALTELRSRLRYTYNDDEGVKIVDECLTYARAMSAKLTEYKQAKERTMEEKTLTALKESIAKWEKHVEADFVEDVNIGWRNCPLCILFYDKDGDEFSSNHCRGCPVMNTTGKTSCNGSPYSQAHPRWLEWKWADGLQEAITKRDKWRKAATEELEFLKSLLPAEKDLTNG